MLGNAWFSVLAAMVEKSVVQGLPGRFCRVSSAWTRRFLGPVGNA